MPAYKLQHIPTKRYLSTTASSRYFILYFAGGVFEAKAATVKEGGRVYSSRRGVDNMHKRMGSVKNEFQVVELN